MNEHEQIEQWIAKHGVTRCPTQAHVPNLLFLKRQPVAIEGSYTQTTLSGNANDVRRSR